MKLLFIGDPHLDSRNPLNRIDDYREVTINKLKEIHRLCLVNGVKMVIFAGDMFHRYDISLHYLTAVIEVFNLFKDSAIEVYSLVGNHDLPRNTFALFDTTPLALLFKTGIIKPLVTYENGVAKCRYLEEDGITTVVCGADFTRAEVIDSYDLSNVTGLKILVMHYATDNTIPGESISREQLSQFSVVVSGHDHHYYEPSGKKPLVLRPGSLTRRTKDDYNLTRNIVVYLVDTAMKTVEEFVLDNVAKAELVFTNEVFMEDFENPYNAGYNTLFTGLFMNNNNTKVTTVTELINDLPEPVTETTKKILLEHLKNI